jgi:O-antigen/teichoic acid export membrane protein
MLGAIVGIGAVGLYTPAYELTARLLIVPGSLLTAMFPMVSAASNGEQSERARLARIFSLSVRNLLLLLAPAVVMLSIFAPEILRLWLGHEYADHSAVALRCLAVGVMINSLSHVPCGYLQASGRPDIPARFHVLELVIYVPLTWVLVRSFGITGAAVAWTIRVTLDGTLLFVASRRVLGLSLGEAFRDRGTRVTLALAGLAGAAIVIAATHLPMFLAAALGAALLALFAVAVWCFVLEQSERAAVYHAVGFNRERASSSSGRVVASP